MPKKRNIILTRNLHIEEEEKHENMEVGIGHFVYNFICNRDISVMRGRRCKLTGGKWGDVRLGRCIRSDSDACGRYRIRGNEKFGEEGRNIALIVLFGLAALVGFTGFGSFSDLAIWAGWCLINAILAVVAMIKSK